MVTINLGPFGALKFEWAGSSPVTTEERPATPESARDDFDFEIIPLTPYSDYDSNYESYYDVAAKESGKTSPISTYPFDAINCEEVREDLMEFEIPENFSDNHVFHRPSQAKQPSTFEERLSRYLIEIMALTFDVDFRALNGALYGRNVAPFANTTLTEEEHRDLIGLSYLVQKVNSELQLEETEGVLYTDYLKLLTHIRFAVTQNMWVVEDLAIELIGWYSSAVRPSAWKDTVPGSRDPSPKSLLDDSSDFYDIFRGCKTLINVVSPNDRVTSVLFRAVEERAKSCGMSYASYIDSEFRANWRYAEVIKRTNLFVIRHNPKDIFDRDGKSYIVK